jgi:hypothetical protein
MINLYERGGLWVLSQGVLLLAVVLTAMRFRSEDCCPVMFISGLILLSIGIGVGLAGAIALGRNITPFPKPSEKTFLVRHGIFTDSPSNLHGHDAGVAGVGTGLAKLACAAIGPGADSVLRRQGSS